jgi:hypothetical protein
MSAAGAARRRMSGALRRGLPASSALALAVWGALAADGAHADPA